MSDHASPDDIAMRAKEEIAKAMAKAVENTNANADGDYDEIVEYVDPMPDPYGKAIRYLEQHNILQLFQVCRLVAL